MVVNFLPLFLAESDIKQTAMIASGKCIASQDPLLKCPLIVYLGILDENSWIISSIMEV